MRVLPLRTLVLLVASTTACGDSGSTPPRPDLGASPDMTTAPPPDMSFGTAASYRYVVNDITIPTDSSMYAVDPIGDGTKRNAFGGIVAILQTQMLNLQMEENINLGKGEGLNLFTFHTVDPAFDTDTTNAGVDVYLAQKADPPDFTGNGSFAIDGKVPKATFTGPLAAGTFESRDPRTYSETAPPPTVYIKIVMYQNVAVNMPLVGARIRMKPTKASLLSGQLNGAMRQTDIDSILIPSLASALDAIGKQMPCESNCQQVLSMFDTNKDGTITVDEVRNNGLVKALLAPDVQLFDDQGRWHPSKANNGKDSLTVGVGFTAVKGTFKD